MPKAKSKARRRPLGAADWEEAALRALATGGPVAVSVEAIARTLGATKGSFYWHFADREALLSAALLRWEAQYTDRVIADLERIAEPRKRLTRLFLAANRPNDAWRVHVALSASTEEPVIARTLARVSRRRISYLEACYRSMGYSAARAHGHALHAYVAYLGFLHLGVECPAELPRGRRLSAYVATLLEALIPPRR
ncbi:MAG TPA: helix-turn-helix domain-containing protein [Thermoanaerobaculia bacterium]|nr:helix-turn-helix domain-containing protein [Thermoanaerobaculia bacterium]